MPCRSDMCFKDFCLWFSVKSPWWLWRFYCNKSHSVLHFSSQTMRNSNIRVLKENYMGKTMPDCSLWCNYSITSTQKCPFFSSDCILKFGPLHLLLSITSKRIKLQMWDCAQKKALEKSFNLVTNKSYLKWTKGAKITYRKTCVFFNSRSSGNLILFSFWWLLWYLFVTASFESCCRKI